MFCDFSYFLLLWEKVILLLCIYLFLKIWVVGCSSGEEVYLLVILLCEEGLFDCSIIYVIDINQVVLKKVEVGVYELDCIFGFISNYQKFGVKILFLDYYMVVYGVVVFDKLLCKNVVFFDYSLVIDSVFVEMYLVFCCNVLIYFNCYLQECVFGLFCELLVCKGFLGLGLKELMCFLMYGFVFDEVVWEDCIFQKKGEL